MILTLLVSLGLLGTLPASAQDPVLSAGPAELRMVESAEGALGVALFLAGTTAPAFQQAFPLTLELEAVDGISWLRGKYSRVSAVGRDTLVAQGVLRSPNGTTFQFRDVYSSPGDAGVFFLSRQVTVATPDPGDRGFATRFSLPAGVPVDLSACEFLVPGHWYRDNSFMPTGALAGNDQAETIFIRADRLPLPLIMMREPGSGNTLMILHRNPDGRTIPGDATNRTITDARLQYSSLGVHDRARPSPGIWFPGTEGDRTYYRGGWADRRHPVAANVSHRYDVGIRLTRTADFAAAVAANWSYAFDLSPPALRRVNLPRVKFVSIDLLAQTWREFPDGSAGFPFGIQIPGGQVREYAMQMGFIGQNLPGAGELIRTGLKEDDPALVGKGEKMVDFWVRASPGHQGLPKTWYDANSGFRDYPTFIRIASDGVLGALRAWKTMRDAGRFKPAWLAYARDFGNWLVDHQNPDGSWYRQYDYHNSNPLIRSKTNTAHAIPLLVELFHATGDIRYRKAAMKAGEFCLRDVHQAYRYVGGTPDNPDVRDKEAGILALDGFLALHDLTGEANWLEAAKQAATYIETWTYAWPVPVVAGDPRAEYPPGRDQTGLSLIAVGHSGADNFMAYCPFLFFRLYAKTGDVHFLNFSRFLLHNTKQGMDWDPANPLGYRFPGLQTEVGTVCAPRGHSIRLWLAWVSVNTVTPLSQLEDVYGSMDVDVLAVRPLTEIRAQDQAYAKARGYRPMTSPAGQESGQESYMFRCDPDWAFWVSVTGLGYVYLGYPLLVWVAGRVRPRPVDDSRDPGGRVSVVVAAHNEGGVLGGKIASLLASTMAGRMEEILVADDASTDGTGAVVDGIADRRVRRLVFAGRRGKAACLNDAVAAARGEILVLTDARQAVAPDALERLVRCLGDPAVGVASGELVFPPGRGQGLAAYWQYERWLRRQESRAGSVPGATGALYAMRREQFPPIPAGTILDDVYVPMKVREDGRRCVVVAGAHVFEEVSAAPAVEFVRKRRTLAGCVQLARRHPRWLQDWGFASHKVARLATPWLLAGVFAGSWGVSRWLFWAQAAAYAAAGLGWLAAARGRRMPVLGALAIVLTLNAAAVAGLWDGLRGRWAAAWNGRR